jgi:uroporphyrinogen-III synthase
MAKYKVLSTKKLEPSLVTQAEEHDIEIVEQEFISIKPVWNQETFDRIIGFPTDKKFYIALTSANAVDALNSYMHVGDAFYVIKWNIFCLSGKTKQAVLNAKLLEKNIVGEANNASGLAKKIIEAGADEIIFFCGSKRRDELPTILKNANIKVHEVILYENTETPVTLNEHFDAILFFSPSGAQSFFSANELSDSTVCFAIGLTTATSVSTFTQNKVIVSIAPNQEELVEEVIEHFKQKSIVR